MSNAEKKIRLEKTITSLQRQHGLQIVRPLKDVSTQPTYVPTGFVRLDQALGGGIVRGRITELLTIPTSGGTSLTLKIIASAQAQATAVYLDLERVFNPDYAARLGVDLRRLILIRPIPTGRRWK